MFLINPEAEWSVFVLWFSKQVRLFINYNEQKIKKETNRNQIQ